MWYSLPGGLGGSELPSDNRVITTGGSAENTGDVDVGRSVGVGANRCAIPVLDHVLRAATTTSDGTPSPWPP